MGAMLIIGMGPRKAGEAKTSPASSTEQKGSIVKLPASLLSIEGEDGAASPEPGDEVELTGTVEQVDGDVIHIRVAEAMVDQPETVEAKPEMSEEDSLLEMAKKADEERA